MKPTDRDARLWPNDSAGLRALVSVRWRTLIGTPARRARTPAPADRNAAVRALFAQTLYGKRRDGHAGIEASAPGAPPAPIVLRVFPIAPELPADDDPPALG